MFVRYDACWTATSELKRVLGINPDDVPERVPRRADWRALSDKAQAGLEKRYGSFARRLAALPPVIAPGS